MRIDTLVAAMVRKLLIDPGGNEKAIYIHFDLSMSHYAEKKTYTQRRGLHLLYFLPVGYSYVTVFSAVTNAPFAKIGEVAEWKHECTHDICWRDIQVFSNTYFDMAKEINVAMEKDGLCPIAPKDMQENNGFSLFEKMFDWVPVKITKDSEDPNSYRRKVEVINEK